MKPRGMMGKEMVVRVRRRVRIRVDRSELDDGLVQ